MLRTVPILSLISRFLGMTFLGRVPNTYYDDGKITDICRLTDLLSRKSFRLNR